MKKRLPALLTCFALLLSGTALAVQNSTSNFQKTKTYSENFTDVAAGSTFHDNIAALYEYGLSIGKGDGTFGVGDNVTVGAVITFSARIHSLYQYGDAEAGAAVHSQADGNIITSASYAAYLNAENALPADFSVSYSAAATRAQVAGILADCLPESALPQTWADKVTSAHAIGNYIPDVTASTPYEQEILKLYGCGVSRGSDARGDFYPSSKITRGALAAMLTRMVDPSLRSEPVIRTVYSAAGKTWSDLITGDTSYIAAPATTAAVTSDVNYMLRQESAILALHYGRQLTTAFVNKLIEESLSAVKQQCEELYNSVNCSYQPDSGEVRLTFGAVGCTAAQLKEYRAYTLAQAIAVHDQLWQSGRITAKMTNYEKARVYYTWVCENCDYDYGASDNSVSHIAYSLFKNHLAVCDGYTGAYNLLLKLDGIPCHATSNDSHIWTVAKLDGTIYHIDTTWGDSSGKYDGTIHYEYFAMTPEESRSVHSR